jgi:Mg-chelatase subunit ChlD
VYEQDTLVTPSDVSTQEVGMAVVIVIDRSGSMREGGVERPQLRIDSARQAALALVDILNPTTDLVGIIGFHDEIGPTLELTHDAGAAHNMVYDQSVITAEDGRNTALYNSVYQALDWLIDNPDPAVKDELNRMQRAVVVFTDGRNTEPGFSAENVRDRALEFGIPVYTVGVDTDKSWDPVVLPELEAQFEDADWLARSTDARYLRLGSAAERDVLLKFFGGLISQRTQYRLTYQTQAAQGIHALRVQVTTTDESGRGKMAEGRADFRGRLQLPAIKLIAPADGFELTREAGAAIPAEVEVSFPDGISRSLARVDFLASGTQIGSASASTDSVHYRFKWDVSEVRSDKYTLSAKAFDSILSGLGSAESANQVTVTIIEPQPTLLEAVIAWVETNWLSLLLAPAVIVLFILLVATRRQVAQGVRAVTSTATGVLKQVTRPLGPSRAPAKLVVTRGANVGREFKMDAQVIKVGRDPQFCDFALYDQYASNPHFTITQGQALDFYIKDEQSMNGTVLNGYALPALQAIPLPFDSVIRAGETELSFKRIGGPTRPLPRPTQKVPPSP